MDEYRLVYLAGMIDGEGTISIRKSKTAKGTYTLSPIIHIYNTDKAVLEMLVSWFNIGKVYENGKPKGNRKQVYALYYTRADIKELLPKLKQYLHIKKRQAMLVEYVCSLLSFRNRSAKDNEMIDTCVDTLRVLNKRGTI